MGNSFLLNQKTERFRFFHGVEVRTLQVFDKSPLEHFIVRYVVDHHRNVFKTCLFRSEKSPLPGDDLEMIPFLPDDDRLQDSLCTDRFSQFSYSIRVEPTAWLGIVRNDKTDLNLVNRSGRVCHSCVCGISREQSFQPSPQHPLRHAQSPLSPIGDNTLRPNTLRHTEELVCRNSALHSGVHSWE